MKNFSKIKQYINEKKFDTEEEWLLDLARKDSNSNGKYYIDKKKSKKVDGFTLYRIVAGEKINVPGVKAGDVGGWIESYDNLSMEGSCWVSDDAMVYGDAGVSDNAKVYGKADVWGKAKIHGDAQVYGNAEVRDSTEVYGKAKVYGDAKVIEEADVFGDAEVFGKATILSKQRISTGKHSEPLKFK